MCLAFSLALPTRAAAARTCRGAVHVRVLAPQARTKVRVVCARPYHALFMHNMLIRPTPSELLHFGEPDFVIYNAGDEAPLPGAASRRLMAGVWRFRSPGGNVQVARSMCALLGGGLVLGRRGIAPPRSSAHRVCLDARAPMCRLRAVCAASCRPLPGQPPHELHDEHHQRGPERGQPRARHPGSVSLSVTQGAQWVGPGADAGDWFPAGRWQCGVRRGEEEVRHQGEGLMAWCVSVWVRVCAQARSTPAR